MTILDSLPATVHGAFKNIFYDAVMTVERPPIGGDPADPSSGTPQEPLKIACKAYVTKYSAYYRANSLISDGDRKVIVLAKSMAGEPVKNAHIEVQGIPFLIVAYDDGGSNRSVWEIQGRMA